MEHLLDRVAGGAGIHGYAGDAGDDVAGGFPGYGFDFGECAGSGGVDAGIGFGDAGVDDLGGGGKPGFGFLGRFDLGLGDQGVGFAALASVFGDPALFGGVGRLAGGFGGGEVTDDLAFAGLDRSHHLGHHMATDDKEGKAEEDQQPENL